MYPTPTSTPNWEGKHFKHPNDLCIILKGNERNEQNELAIV